MMSVSISNIALALGQVRYYSFAAVPILYTSENRHRLYNDKVKKDRSDRKAEFIYK
jgi:hypothetical protein